VCHFWGICFITRIFLPTFIKCRPHFKSEFPQWLEFSIPNSLNRNCVFVQDRP
jgi:hypothetical protein